MSNKIKTGNPNLDMILERGMYVGDFLTFKGSPTKPRLNIFYSNFNIKPK
tara:strand:- start:195 stop:344 length:150 start_codon:yes stop_codon:yes gene_type:complete